MKGGRSPDGSGALADELAARIAAATDDNLTDDGRYFTEFCTDLTMCRHGDTGEYNHRGDGPLVELLWNNRLLLLHALYAASGIEARSDETRSGSAEGESPVPKGDAHEQS